MNGQVSREARNLLCQGDDVSEDMPGKVDPRFFEHRVKVSIPVRKKLGAVVQNDLRDAECLAHFTDG